MFLTILRILASNVLILQDAEIFERGGPEAVIYKILERGGLKSLNP